MVRFTGSPIARDLEKYIEVFTEGVKCWRIDSVGHGRTRPVSLFVGSTEQSPIARDLEKYTKVFTESMRKSTCRLPTLLQTCRALYDYPSWKNSASPTTQRIFHFHHKMTIYSDSSKRPSNFSAECVGTLTYSSTLAQSATLKIHTALNQTRTHLRSKS